MKVEQVKRDIEVRITLNEIEALALHTLCASIPNTGPVGKILTSIGDGIEDHGEVGFAILPDGVSEELCEAVRPLANMEIDELVNLPRG